MCFLIQVSSLSRSGYYKWKKSITLAEKDNLISEHIKAIHSLRPFYGYRRVQAALKKEGIYANHKRVYRLMRLAGLQSVIRKKRRYFGKSGSVIYPNVLERNFKANIPNKKLVTDITYLPTTKGFIYLSVVQDLYSNEIVAYNISPKNDLALVLATINKLKNIPNAIFHSDQGYRYTSKKYQQKLKDLCLIGSHSRKGNCLDNACVESFFSHLKTEAFYKKNLLEENDIIHIVNDYISFYNTQRFQKRLGQLSPVEYRKKLAA